MKYSIVQEDPARVFARMTPKPISTPAPTVRLEKEPVKDPVVVERESRFRGAVEAYLREIGAKSEYWWAPWVLQTRAGELCILVLGNRIVCRFNEPVRAAEVLGIRGDRLEDSGAWNFRFEDGPSLDRVDVFRTEMAWLLRHTTATGLRAVVDHGSASKPETPAAKRRGTMVGVAAPAVLSAARSSAPIVVPPVK